MFDQINNCEIYRVPEFQNGAKVHFCLHAKNQDPDLTNMNREIPYLLPKSCSVEFDDVS